MYSRCSLHGEAVVEDVPMNDNPAYGEVSTYIWPRASILKASSSKFIMHEQVFLLSCKMTSIGNDAVEARIVASTLIATFTTQLCDTYLVGHSQRSLSINCLQDEECCERWLYIYNILALYIYNYIVKRWRRPKLLHKHRKCFQLVEVDFCIFTSFLHSTNQTLCLFYTGVCTSFHFIVSLSWMQVLCMCAAIEWINDLIRMY